MFALPLLLLSSPLLLTVAGVTMLLSGSFPFFRQKRPGYQEQLFTLYKLRTLFDRRKLLSPILQPWGRFLRTYSIDELPQLYNVIRGEMSLVGPRPLLEEYLPLYNEAQRLRHAVKPGITGWAQIHGRNELSWAERFRLDLWYVKNQSLRTDLRILRLTVLQIIKPSGVRPEGLKDHEKFKGNKD